MNTSHVETTETSVASEPHYPLHGRVLAAVIIALFLTLLMAALDGSVVDTATPRIIADLHGFSLYSWLVTIYLLASTTTIPLVGKLSDVFGRKWFLIGGVLIFLLGSILAGTAQTMVQLIIFRGVQGLGSGILQTLALVLIGDLFPPKERARWIGVFSAVIILASVIGPLAGGWITDHFGWRWIFYINIPLGLCALIMLLVWLPANLTDGTTTQSNWERLRHIDFIGALTIVVGTICLLLGLTLGGQSYAWSSPLVIGLFVSATLMFLLFFYVESRVQDPIMPLDLFKSWIFSAGAVLSLLLGMVLFGIVVYLPLFMQAVQGRSPTSSGAIMTPLTFTIALLSIITGIVVSRIGRYQVTAIIGAIILTVGTFLMTLMTSTTSTFEISRNVFLIGIGLGMLLPLVNVATQNSLPQSRMGVGTGAITFLRSMGSTLATAVLGTIVNTVSASQVSAHLPAAAHRFSQTYLKAATDKQVLTGATYRHTIIQQGIADSVQAAHVAPGPQHDATIATLTQQTTMLLDQLFEVVRQALASSIHQAFVIVFCLCLAVILTTILLRDSPALPVKKAEEQPVM